MRIRMFVYHLFILSVCIQTSTTAFPTRSSNSHHKEWAIQQLKNQHDLEHTGMFVKDCPPMCLCVQMSNNTYLYVEKCTSDPIRYLPKLLKSHMNVESLHFQRSPISSLPHTIIEMSKLTQLFLDRNEFTQIPDEAMALPKLQVLSFDHNKIKRLPSEISQLSLLQTLLLTNNELESLPVEMAKLSMLDDLELGYNRLEELPNGLGNLTRLTILDISYNKLKTLPHDMRNFPWLTMLDLCHNEIEIIPNVIWNLQELRNLYLCQNYIKYVPAEISRLTSLNSIDLRGNQLGTLTGKPNGFCRLHSTNHMHGEVYSEVVEYSSECVEWENKGQIIPCDLFHLKDLMRVDLSNNTMKYFGCEETPMNLIYLNLSYNSLNDRFCDILQEVEILDLSHNNISTISGDCGLVSSHFHSLDFSFNKIESFSFSQFCHDFATGTLRHMSFKNNSISVIKTDVFFIPNCFDASATIDLSNNRLFTLDSWPLVISMDRRINLDVSGNLLSTFTNSAGGTFSSSYFRSTFRLQNNKIRYFMDVFNGWNIIVNTMDNLNTLLRNAYFDLGGNPLTCDCTDYGVYKFIQNSNSKQYDNLECHEPLSLRGQKPDKIPLDQFVCDISTNCTNGCTCTNVPHFQVINVTCQEYNQRDIPDIVPSLPKDTLGYHLDLCNQSLSRVTFRPYLKEAIDIILSHNYISDIKVESQTFQNVKLLHLDFNRLQRLPESVTVLSNQSVVNIRLGNNPWLCDCKALEMKEWLMMNSRVIKDIPSIMCHSPQSVSGIRVRDIERHMVCPNENKTAVYVVGAISSVVFIYIVYLAISDRLKYAKWRFVGSDECDGECKEFDIFMCSCSDIADSEYVENYLIPELERRDFRVCYHREHFHGGKPIHVNMSEAIEKSKRTLVFFSNNFRMSGYSMFEFHTAHDLDIQNNTRRLITIKDTDLDMGKLDISEVYYFQTHTYIAREDVKFWKLLEGSLPKKRLGAQVRNYP